jgi:hypothetical protein
MKPRQQPDATKMLDALTAKHPGLFFGSSGHVVFRTSSGSSAPQCEPIIDEDQKIKLAHACVVERYEELVASSGRYSVPRGAAFSIRAIGATADDLGLSDYQVRNILREAGYGRGKVTRSSY